MGDMSPVYSDGAKNSFGQWLGPIVVVYLVIHAFLTNQALALVLAFPLAFYVAYTWHTAYYLTQDALVVRFLWPRRFVVPLADVVLVGRSRIFPAGDGLLVSRPGKAPVFVRPKDPDRLRELLNERIGRVQPPPVDQPRTQRGRPRRRRPPRR